MHQIRRGVERLCSSYSSRLRIGGQRFAMSKSSDPPAEGLGGGSPMQKSAASTATATQMDMKNPPEPQKQEYDEVEYAKSREFEDKYLRALAETENVRSRLTKQIQDSKLFAIQGFCKDLTEIEDILRMAIESVPKEQLTGNNKPLKDLYEGLTMTSARLMQVFKTHGLTQINPIDVKFNPNEHEAVVVQEIAGKEAGTVIFVSKLGYKLHDRVIRPAIVGVAK